MRSCPTADVVSAPSLNSFKSTMDKYWGSCQFTLEESKQLVDEASRFHLGSQRQHSAVICSGASAAEYCAPVWSRSAHTSRVDVQLNSTMRLISGTLRSTPLPWLQLGNNRGASMSILKTYCKHAMQGTKLVKSANKVDYQSQCICAYTTPCSILKTDKVTYEIKG